MYGIVNKAIEDLVTWNYGIEKWEAVKERCKIDIDFFISNEPYPDDITYKLVGAISEEMQIPAGEVLAALGEWWVLKTGKEKYGSLMEAGGNSLREFLISLPAFHSRIMLMYPKLTPPEFRITEMSDHSALVHYHSKRSGLQEFVRGLLTGLGKMYDTPVNIEVVSSRDSGSSHEIFKVTW